jgi:predicted outer membrane repeat protein
MFGSTLTVKDCLITGNAAPDYPSACTPGSDPACLGQGGGIGAAQSTVFVTDSIITENSATYGGGLRVAGIGALTVTDSVIGGNTASNAARLGQGGGIYGSAPPLWAMTVKDSLITDNTADTQGGGIYVNSRALTIKDSSIFNNTAGTNGGGIYLNSSTLTVKDSTTTPNTPNDIAQN